MAGLLFAVSEIPGTAEQLVQERLLHMLHFPWLRSYKFYSSHFAAALILPATIAPALWTGDPSEYFGGVFGEYYPHDQEITCQSSALEEIQQLYANGKEYELKNLNGLYNLIFWDARRHTLLIANDMTGSLLLFQASVPGGVIWCSEPGILFNAPGVSRELDNDAMRSLLRFGFQPDNRTTLKGVSVLPPATVLRVCIVSGQVQYYIDSGDPLLLEEVNDDYEKEFPEILRKAVSLRIRGKSPVCLPLSGGEDSRWLLAMALDLGVHLSAYTLDGCQTGDARASRRVATQAGISHTVLEIQQRVIVDYTQFLTIALASTMDWHAAVFLPLLHTIAPNATIPLGYLGGTFCGAMIRNTEDHSSRSMFIRQVSKAFEPAELGIMSLNPPQDIDSLSLLRAEILWNLYGRQRKYISYLVRLAWNFGRPVCPFADRRVIRLGLSLARSDLYLQNARRRVFRRQFPALAKLVSGNDHLPVDSFALRRLKSTLRGTIFSTIVRRLLGLSRPNYDTERLRPLLLEALLVLPLSQQHLLVPIMSKTPVAKGLALLSILNCHPEVYEDSQWQ